MHTPFDMSLIQRGARLRRSPFFEATQRWGARAYTVYNHMLFPINFDDLEAEYWQLVNHVTLWDVSVERQVEITGPDAFTFTNMLTPRDLNTCAVGQGKYVVITAGDGGIINDPVLLRLGENHFWLALADSDVLLWARGVALSCDLKVTITEPDVSPLQLQGPKAKPVVQTLFGDRAMNLSYYWFLETSLDGIPVVVTRTGWSGEVGYEIYLRERSRGEALWERIMEAGKPADYIGRDALRRIKAAGVQRKLVGVEIEGGRIEFNATKWPVLAGGRPCGHITSAIHSPRLKKNVGYAMVPVAHAALGARLTVVIPDVGEREATVVPKPFVDPTKTIPKA